MNAGAVYPLGLLVAAVPVLFLAIEMFLRKRWDPCGKHCFITGGSSGAGLALAKALVESGANVSIVARDPTRLEEALQEVEKVRRSSKQIIRSYAYSVNTLEGSNAAIKAASESFGGCCPDAFFLFAGSSKPGFFVEQTEDSIREGMENTYYAQAFTALAAAKLMVRDNVKGKIVFCASVLAYLSIIGYSPYAPGKFAIRGLAETLQSEFLLYGIGIHIAFPGTMYTKGYYEENLTKPAVTLKIEETDGGDSPEFVANAILRGVRSGKFHITTDFIGNVFRTSTAGSSPRNSYMLDWIHGLVGYVALPVWRQIVDNHVRGHRVEHEQYLRERGYRKS